VTQRFDLTGRVAWVIGGAGLLGTEVCKALAEHGAAVVLHDLNAERAEAVARDLREAGHTAHADQLDIIDEPGVTDAAKRIADTHGRLDVMVNMTYAHMKSSWDRASAEEFDRCIRVGITGSYVASREAGHIMAEQGSGSIIHFSSMYGVVSPDPGMYPDTQPVNPIGYGVSKAGILQLVRYQAVMQAKQGVRVNAIVPGPFPIPATHGQDNVFMNNLEAKVPMGRVGRASEIAGALVFLASDSASFVTGTSITVDGGWTAW